MWQIIGGYFLRVIIVVGNNVVVIVVQAVVFLVVFSCGRWLERHQWRKEIKNGKRLGKLIQGQLRKRDNRIQSLVVEIQEKDDRIERVGIKHKRLIGLSREIQDVVISEDVELLKKRKMLRG